MKLFSKNQLCSQIDSLLLEDPSISDYLVGVRGDKNGKRIILIFVVADTTWSPDSLAERLGSSLPNDDPVTIVQI